MSPRYGPIIAGAVAGSLAAALVLVVYLQNQEPVTASPGANEPSRSQLAVLGDTTSVEQRRPPREENDPQVVANATALTALRLELARLQERLALVEAPTNPSVAGLEPSPAFTIPTPDSSELSEDSQVDESELHTRMQAQADAAKDRVRQRFDAIDSVFFLEEVDDEWRDDMDGRIQHVFANNDAMRDANLDHIDCRSKRCRLEIEFIDDGNFEAKQANLAAALAEVAPRMAANYEDIPGAPGRKKAIVYFVRSGHRLLEY